MSQKRLDEYKASRRSPATGSNAVSFVEDDIAYASKMVSSSDPNYPSLISAALKADDCQLDLDMLSQQLPTEAVNAGTGGGIAKGKGHARPDPLRSGQLERGFREQPGQASVQDFRPSPPQPAAETVSRPYDPTAPIEPMDTDQTPAKKKAPRQGTRKIDGLAMRFPCPFLPCSWPIFRLNSGHILHEPSESKLERSNAPRRSVWAKLVSRRPTLFQKLPRISPDSLNFCVPWKPRMASPR